MTSKEKNIAVYQSALSFLGEIIPDGMTKQDLEKYYVGNKFNYNSLTDIFEELIASAPVSYTHLTLPTNREV